jgi:hypothetical protein
VNTVHFHSLSKTLLKGSQTPVKQVSFKDLLFGRKIRNGSVAVLGALQESHSQGGAALRIHHHKGPRLLTEATEPLSPPDLSDCLRLPPGPRSTSWGSKFTSPAAPSREALKRWGSDLASSWAASRHHGSQVHGFWGTGSTGQPGWEGFPCLNAKCKSPFLSKRNA